MWIAVHAAPAECILLNDLLPRFFSAASLHRPRRFRVWHSPYIYNLSSQDVQFGHFAIRNQSHKEMRNWKLKTFESIQKPFFRLNPGAELEVL
jgi:hypothetical protein